MPTRALSSVLAAGAVLAAALGTLTLPADAVAPGQAAHQAQTAQRYPAGFLQQYTLGAAADPDAEPGGDGDPRGFVIEIGRDATIREVMDGEVRVYGSYGSDTGRHVGPVDTRDEIIDIQDWYADGRMVGAHWRVRGSSPLKQGICINDNGFADQADFEYCQLPNIMEGKTIEMHVGSCDGDATGCDSLSDWHWGNETSRPYAINGWIDYTDDLDYRVANSCQEGRREGDC